MVLALEGIRVIDLTQVELGPVATQMLGDFGADVIKIERPGSGDLSRWSFQDPAGPDNPVFLSLNRNKRSLALDLRQEAGKQVLRDLVATADVIVDNFRPGVMERMGFGYDQVRQINPRIIAASGSGFGPRGPYAHKGGQDVLAQAVSGAMFRRADPSLPLAIYATAIADYATGMHLAQGILLALRARELTGQGQRVETSLYDAMLSMQLQEATVYLMRQVELNWAAKALSGAFETADGAIVIVGAFKQNPLRDISTALGLDDLSLRPEFATEVGQEENRAALQQIFAERLRTQPSSYWIERLEAVDMLCAPVRHLSAALEDEQSHINDMVWRLPHETVGEVVTVGNPIKLSDTPAEGRVSPPRLGEHSVPILNELGYTRERIASLQEMAVIS